GLIQVLFPFTKGKLMHDFFTAIIESHRFSSLGFAVFIVLLVFCVMNRVITKKTKLTIRLKLLRVEIEISVNK
ncbi:hypothetical protein, partial [Shigella sp. FJ200801]